MKKKSSTISITFLIFCFCFFFLPKVIADGNPSLVHARPVLGMRPRAGNWSEVIVSISNPGISKEVDIVIYSQNTGVGAEIVLCKRPVFLHSQSKREEKFYVPFGAASDFEVQLFQKGIRIAKETFPVKVTKRDSPVFLIVDEVAASYSFLKDLKLHGYDGSPVPLSTRPGNLPERWFGYDGIDITVLGSFSETNMNSNQIQALKQWVFSGGTLIISSGGRFHQYNSSFVEELTDICPLGVRGVTELRSFSEYFGSRPKIDNYLLLTEIHPGMSEVMLQEEELPLIVQSDYGSGKVIFLSFDPSEESLKNWEGANTLWAKLVSGKRELFPEGRTSLADNIEPLLMEVVGVSVPEFRRVAVFLLGYFGLLTLTSLIFSLRKRRELAWLTYPVVIPLGIWLVYHTGQVGKKEIPLSINEVSLTELPSGSGQGTSRSYLGFFSPRGLETSITINDVNGYGPVLSRMLPERAQFKAIETNQEDTFTLKELTLNAGVLQILSFNDIVYLGGGIESKIIFTGEGLEGEIKNNTGENLYGGVLVYNRQVKPVGPLNKGETLKVKIAGPESSNWQRDFSTGRIKAEQDVVREKIISSLFEAPILLKTIKPGFVFFAWLSRPALELKTTEVNAVKDGFALVVSRIEPAAKDRGEIFIPKGICDVVPVGTQVTLIRGKWLRKMREDDVTVDFILPPACKRTEARDIKIYFQFDAADMVLSLKVYNWEKQKWVSLQTKKEIPLSQAQSYLADGRVRVNVEGRASREMRDDNVPTGFWQIKDLDIEIRGKLNDSNRTPM